jgi:hypothetical protein
LQNEHQQHKEEHDEHEKVANGHDDDHDDII